MRRYERASTLLTSNRPIEDRGKLLGDNAAVSSMLDRLLRRFAIHPILALITFSKFNWNIVCSGSA